jgi:hypothetical protein
MTLYSFDTNSWITGWRYYDIRSFSDVWAGIDDAIDRGKVRCVKMVHEDLGAKDDGIFRWVAKREGKLVYPTDDVLMGAVRRVLAVHPNLFHPDSRKSASDPWVIALALACDGVVVCEEAKYQGPNYRWAKIPTACCDLDVRCIDFPEFIAEQHWTFARDRF